MTTKRDELKKIAENFAKNWMTNKFSFTRWLVS